MIKIVAILLSVFVASQAAGLLGGFQPVQVNDEVLSIARWSTSQLSGYTGIEGDHTVLTVRNVQKQIVAGINYKFTLDVLVAAPENKYVFRTCDVTVYVKFDSTKSLSDASCAANPQYPDA